MTYAYPWAIYLPFLLVLVWLVRRPKKLAVAFPSTDHFPAESFSWRSFIRLFTLFICSMGTLYFLTMAAMRPQFITKLPSSVEARNLMLALDVSGSMRTRDFYYHYQPTSRLSAVKAVVQEFIAGRTEDRLGLVVFGSNAFLECPLSLDHELLKNMVNELEVGMAGDGTALGDGLGIALKRIEKLPGKSKAVILLTDGVHTAGTVNPLQAARVAADLGIVIHTIGIGSSKTASQANLPPFMRGNKQFEFDEETLRSISEISGGVYFNAANMAELQNVYNKIDELERSSQEQPAKLKVKELYHSYALKALLTFTIYLLANLIIFPRLPW